MGDGDLEHVPQIVLNCPGFVAGMIIDLAIFKNNGDGTCMVKIGDVIVFQEKLRFQYFQVYKNNLYEVACVALLDLESPPPNLSSHFYGYRLPRVRDSARS